ncbi:hypothetical protein [Roseomonas indoligenes]|uniref:Uncharacterized protein n=1 Tax=Roseomonas indoligenes TaxID=2820811 RepID=A0A940MYK8_9PROT|nr:hypothetical protein [Pararoseomonas indoligenes]MBP0494526.1 hypothetical protein [Pararoseomonas indoligenes]
MTESWKELVTIPSLNALTMGILGFLAAWVMKHILDRTALPLFIDYLSRTTKKGAMIRATDVVRDFYWNLEMADNPKQLAVATHGTVLKTVVVGILSLLVVDALGRIADIAASLIGVCFCSLFVLILQMVHRNHMTLIRLTRGHVEAVKAESLARASKILRGAKIPDPEIAEILARLVASGEARHRQLLLLASDVRFSSPTTGVDVE